ncbi:hypothetical protein CAPTEDRAFT_83392, partial [Capitella teleta]
KIPCHKVVLAGTCDYFRTMFVTELTESRSDEVQISEISADIGLTLVNYLYSGTIEITEQNAQALLAACNMLLLVDVKKDIVKFLSRQICNSNCVSLMNLARFYELDSLRKAAHKFLTKHWTELIDTKEMGELQEDDFVELLKSLGSQEDRFRFLQNWIRLGGSDKDDRFSDLIEHVTLSKCSKEFICNVVMEEERMNHPKGMKLIQKAMQALMLADQPTTSSLESLAQWRTLPNMNIPRFGHSSIYHKDELYIVGGMESKHGYLDFVERLDAKSLKWEDLCDLPLGLSTPMLVIVKDKLFVLGGVKGGGHSKMVLVYHDDAWEERNSMPEECRRGAAVEFDGFIFVVGGRNIGNRAKSQCFSYVAQVKQWRTLPNMRLPRYAHSSIYHKDMLYLVGGMVSQNEYVNSVERLDTKLLNWVDLRDLPGVQGLSNALLVIVNDRLFVLGGLTRSCHNKMVMEYHFENDAWEERNSMPEECRRGAAVEFDGFIFVVGGQEKSC